MKGKRPFAVIMAGGQGTRFWPLSRRRKPKQLLALTGRASLLEQTYRRVRRLLAPEGILLVALASQAREVRRALPELPRKNLLIEPKGKNTAPCLGLAALEVMRREPDAALIALPSDHFIGEEAFFRKLLRLGTEEALTSGAIVTLGIRPRGPETGFGYIRKGRLLREVQGEAIHEAQAFKEKPPLPLARRYLRSGNYLWNSGIFIWPAARVMEEIERQLPALARGLRRIGRAMGGPDAKKVIKEVYPKLPSISIDYGLMEGARKVLVIPADLGWHDLGSWAGLRELLPKDREGNLFLPARRGQLFSLDSRNCLILSQKPLVATLGLRGLVIVETEDCLLVCPEERAQDVGGIVEGLRRSGLGRFT